MGDSQEARLNEADYLYCYKKVITSQFGEDGIIEKIFEIIKNGDKWCVDLGAHDGRTFSNTWDLIKNKGWSGIMVESEPQRYAELLKTCASCDRVTCMNKQVNFDGEDAIDSILAKTQIPEDFDLLSIDIDGSDYFIWESMRLYRPKVVIIEFNPTIPIDIEFIQPKNIRLHQGSSLYSISLLGREKGYELVATTEVNAFFVRKELFPLFRIKDNSLASVHKDKTKQYQTRLFQLYDGNLVLAGHKNLIWHEIEIDQEKIQVLPKFLRRYPDATNPFRLELLKLYTSNSTGERIKYSLRILLYPLIICKRLIKKFVRKHK